VAWYRALILQWPGVSLAEIRRMDRDLVPAFLDHISNDCEPFLVSVCFISHLQTWCYPLAPYPCACLAEGFRLLGSALCFLLLVLLLSGVGYLSNLRKEHVLTLDLDYLKHRAKCHLRPGISFYWHLSNVTTCYKCMIYHQGRQVVFPKIDGYQALKKHGLQTRKM
jgi:hypothetical protein